MRSDTTTGSTPTRSRARDEPLRIASIALGGVFLAIGICGFIPRITDIDQLELAGRHSDALLFGVFNVSVLHNVIHLLFGILGLVMSRTSRRSRVFLLGGGLVYALLGLYGVLIHQGDPTNVIPVNAADNWLHVALAVLMIALGVLLSRDTAATGRP